MIIVTGGAGFIGSNLIQQLNRTGERNILLVDSFAPAPNLTGPEVPQSRRRGVRRLHGQARVPRRSQGW